MSEANVHKVLMTAMDFDESGEKEKAIEYYTQAVEMILSIDDPQKRQKLNKFAKQALDRAECLKGIRSPANQSPSHTVTVKNSVNPVKHVTIAPSGSTSTVSIAKHTPKLEVAGKNIGYTLDEKKVLEFSSKINSKMYVPFMDIDLKERFYFPIPFTDKDGLLELAPKQKRDFSSFARVSELHENPQIIYGTHADFYSIRQTIVSDCSFISSLAVAALYERKFNKRILTSMIYPRNAKDEPVYNPSGKYTVRLHVNGIPRKVVIDDYLPVGKYNQLLCSYSSNKSEFWISLLEKAYMKLMGGYDFPGSNSNIDLHALTGWIPERVAIRTKEADFDANGVFDRLKEGMNAGRCLVTVATGDLSDAECERTGLVSTHAYAVLQMIEIDGVKLIQLKNPWSHLRWRGNYSELDTVHWTPDLQERLNFDPKLAANYDNGVFWIDYNSILNFFDVFYLNWDPSLFLYTYCIHQCWSAGCGPAKDAYSINDNPQFSLKIPAGRGSIWILLTRHITTIEDFRENKEYITVLVYRNDGKRVYYPQDPGPYIDGIRINSPHYLCKIRMDPTADRKFTLVISQYEKTSTIYYSLRAYCRENFELSEISNRYASVQQVNGEWTTNTAGGCQNHPTTYKNNPVYKLTIGPSDLSNLVVELRGPKIYQVGLELTIVSLEDSNITAPFISKTTGSYRSGFCVLDLEQLPCGVFHVRPSTFLPQQEGPFILKIKSTTNVQIERIR